MKARQGSAALLTSNHDTWPFSGCVGEGGGIHFFATLILLLGGIILSSFSQTDEEEAPVGITSTLVSNIRHILVLQFLAAYPPLKKSMRPTHTQAANWR